MTKEKILAMEAGRELDGLVAKEVMSIGVEYPFVEGHPYYLREEKPGEMKWDVVHFYSTDIFAAWQVVEKLVEEDIPIAIILWHTHKDWFVQTHKDMNVVCSSAPEAICKAALIAKT